MLNRRGKLPRNVLNSTVNKWWRALLPIFFSLITMFVIPLNLQADNNALDLETREAKVKAAFLYYTLKFVSWPTQAFDSNKQPIQLCFVGARAVHEQSALILKNKTIQSRNIVLRYYPDAIINDTLSSECHMIYLAESTKPEAVQTLKALEHENILTVGDWDEFIEFGGMLNIFRESNRIRFAVNLNALKQTKVRISSEMLQLAAKIVGSP